MMQITEDKVTRSITTNGQTVYVRNMNIRMKPMCGIGFTWCGALYGIKFGFVI